MSEKMKAFPFRWAFPTGQLLLCVILLWPLRSELPAHLRPRPPAPVSRPATVSTVPASSDLKPGQRMIVVVGSTAPKEQRAEHTKEARLLIPGNLNFPAFFFDFLISDLLADRSHTDDDDFRTYWRAVTWPLLAIVFWWMAGRAVEALIAARENLLTPRISPPEVTVAIVLLLFGGGLSLQFAFGGEPGDLDSYLLAAGAGLWAIVGAIMLSARLAQWRVRKAIVADTPPGS